MTIEKAILHFERYVNDDCDTVEHREACKMAVAALREQEERRWIPVTERLPETGRKCLITNGGTVKVGWLRPDGVWKTGVNRNDLWNRFSLYPPTHWMPLPEPPKEEN